MSEHDPLFKFWLEQGWKLRRRQNPRMVQQVSEYKPRLKHEIRVIRNKDFVDYFLMCSDIVRWAKDSGIAVGPGRGSSAGSLCCYLLRITEIDPLQYPMLFERFLDPTRTDPPDIDLDFEDSRRDEVFAYATTKYGRDMVANLGTVTRYKGRNSLDDISRVHRIPEWKIESIKSKLLERAEGHPRFANSLEDTYNSFEDVATIVEQTPALRLAANLEGNIRNFGVHAAGMAILDVKVNEVCATFEKSIGEREGRAIPYDKYDAAYLGFIKFDFLSLNTLGMIARTCKMAGLSLDDLYRLPLDDKETIDAFARGDVLGVFQFEGITTRRILKEVEPTEFRHLCDVNALARPGAQDILYVMNKRLSTKAFDELMSRAAHPILVQHLSRTYGVIVYEEQILMILRDLGGFEPAELNRMRSIIHYKLGGTVFNENYQRFIKGAAAHGVSEGAARKIWDGMVNAAGYAFNVPHSVSYTHIGYWTQWLKVHTTAEFYAGLLPECADDAVRRAKVIGEAEKHGINVLPPKLLESEEDWSIRRDFLWRGCNPVILAGFNIIPGLGPKKTAAIIQWRTENQQFFGNDWYPEWEDLKEIDGIGPKTIETIRDFVWSDDPFKVGHTQRVLEKVREAIANGELPGVPTPSHVSVDIPLHGDFVTWVGIIRKRKYYDAAEQLTKKEIGLSYDDALSKLSDRHLLKYVALYCEDEHGEQVRVAVSRWAYPHVRASVESARIDKDIVVVNGKTSDFQGISIQSKRLWILEP